MTIFSLQKSNIIIEIIWPIHQNFVGFVGVVSEWLWNALQKTYTNVYKRRPESNEQPALTRDNLVD